MTYITCSPLCLYAVQVHKLCKVKRELQAGVSETPQLLDFCSIPFRLSGYNTTGLLPEFWSQELLSLKA